MKTIIQKIHAEPGQRILAMSDIHGELNNLKGLLEKLEYNSDDILVLVGDLIDKGSDSLRTVRYVMKLAARGRVYVSEGNVEEHRLEVLCDTTEGSDARFCELICELREKWGCGLLLDMLAELGIPAGNVTAENADACRRRLWEYYAPEINFLQGLPTILEMGSYLFVHGGIPTDDLEELEGTDRHDWLKNDRFWEKGYRFSRCVVTGHWPVSLYRRETADLRPVFDYDRRIICIDGGCGLKEMGQLNALIFPDKDAAMEEIGWNSYDGFPVVTAQDRQEGKPLSLYVQYFDSRVDRLEEQDKMTLCRHISSGRTFWAPTEFLYYRSDGWHVDDYNDALLEVRPGDEISVVFRNSRGCYGKSNGVLGWYYGRYTLPKA